MNPFVPASLQARLVLASRSPRRRELLSGLGFEFEVLGSTYREDDAAAAPEALVERHALGKAREVAARRPGHLVIGADTLVLVGGETLGKPADDAEAKSMLRRLSGREHEVMTAVVLVRAGAGGAPRESSALSRTRVRFRPLDDAEIAAYVASGECADKAGAYGIQGLAAQFVSGIKGCYFNVMGLPLELTTRMLLAWAEAEDA